MKLRAELVAVLTLLGLLTRAWAGEDAWIPTNAPAGCQVRTFRSPPAE